MVPVDPARAQPASAPTASAVPHVLQDPVTDDEIVEESISRG